MPSAGIRNAIDYAFGLSSQPATTAPAPLHVLLGNSAAGTFSITLDYGVIYTADGRQILPLSTSTPIIVGSGPNQETVTPTAVSVPSPGIYGTTQVTAAFLNPHGQGEPVASASFGLGEAVNDAHALGGLVSIDGRWAAMGGATATITGQKGWTNVTVLDQRGTTAAKSYIAASNGAAMAASTISLY